MGSWSVGHDWGRIVNVLVFCLVVYMTLTLIFRLPDIRLRNFSLQSLFLDSLLLFCNFLWKYITICILLPSEKLSDKPLARCLVLEKGVWHLERLLRRMWQGHHSLLQLLTKHLYSWSLGTLLHITSLFISIGSEVSSSP